MPVPPRLWKGGSRPAIAPLFTITEEDEEEKSRRKKRRRGDSDSHLREDEKKSSSRPDSSTSGHNTYTIHSSADVLTSGRPESLLLKLDERQRLARERREEKEKQIAVREAQLLEREERARQFYEKQLEERRRRLEEQRMKEETRRAAVEEKRRQKLEQERVRYEAVVMRTMERSQRARPKSNRWSWGGTLTTSTSHNSDVDRKSVSTMNLSKHIEPVMTKRLSSSSATLLNSPDKALQKQKSLSSSCIVNRVQSKAGASREKVRQDRRAGMRRMPLTAWENTVVSRLQTPTHSYLARSRSAVSLSGDAVTHVCPRSASCHSASLMPFKTLKSRSSERPVRTSLGLERPIKAGHGQDNPVCRKSTPVIPVDRKDKDYVRKSWSNLSCPTPTLTPSNIKRAPSPGIQRIKVSQPLPVRVSTKPSHKPPLSVRSHSPPPPASLPLSCSNRSLSPGNLRPSRVSPESLRVTPEGKRGGEEEVNSKEEGPSIQTEHVKKQEEAQQEKVEQSESPTKAAAEVTAPKAEANERMSSPPSARPSAGTTDPEEASRLLAEKRRQAREQREREEEEKRQHEEAERRHREEMARRKAEEKAKREEEAQRLAEEKKQKEEEEKRVAEEKRQREKEEAERLQKQKEEEEARQREEDERLRQEREKHFQKEEAERLERKKRLEEIMKRTRRPDQKSPGQKNGDASQQQGPDPVSVPPEIPSITVSSPQQSLDASEHSDSNGHTTLDSLTALPAADSVSADTELKENGVDMETQSFEEVIEVPMVTKLSRTEGDGEEEDDRRKSPLLAFTENGSTRNAPAQDSEV